MPSRTSPISRAMSICGPATSTSDCPFTGLAASRYTTLPTRSPARSATPVITMPP